MAIVSKESEYPTLRAKQQGWKQYLPGYRAPWPTCTVPQEAATNGRFPTSEPHACQRAAVDGGWCGDETTNGKEEEEEEEEEEEDSPQWSETGLHRSQTPRCHLRALSMAPRPTLAPTPLPTLERDRLPPGPVERDRLPPGPVERDRLPPGPVERRPSPHRRPVERDRLHQDQWRETVSHRDQWRETVSHRDQWRETVSHQDQWRETVSHRDQWRETVSHQDQWRETVSHRDQWRETVSHQDQWRETVSHRDQWRETSTEPGVCYSSHGRGGGREGEGRGGGVKCIKCPPVELRERIKGFAAACQEAVNQCHTNRGEREGECEDDFARPTEKELSS
ncbi:unnamed protein product [Boreogadus saida]